MIPVVCLLLLSCWTCVSWFDLAFVVYFVDFGLVFMLLLLLGLLVLVGGLLVGIVTVVVACFELFWFLFVDLFCVVLVGFGFVMLFAV